MKGYSINGYLNAVMLRSEKTLLVEGITDRSLLNRLKGDRAAALGREAGGRIDVAAMLEDDALKGLGKKAVIQALLAKIPTSGANPTIVKKKLGTLVDREWDGLDVALPHQGVWAAPEQDTANFTTMGHSVENYFFRIEAIEAYLRQFFSDNLKQDFFNDLHHRFPVMVGLAAIYSLSIRSIHAITRCDKVINRELVEWFDGRYLVKAQFNAALNARSPATPQSINCSLFINTHIYACLLQHTDVETGRWFCHGHLGEQAIWACIANLAQEHLVSKDIAVKIEKDSLDVRLKHSIDYLCRQNLNLSVPLAQSINWLIE